MKRLIRSSERPLTDRQAKMATKLYNLYQQVFDLLDDKEFGEEGEYYPLLNNPDFPNELMDEIMYLGHL